MYQNETWNITTHFQCKQEIVHAANDVIFKFIVYTTSLAFQCHQVQLSAPPLSLSNTCSKKAENVVSEKHVPIL